MATLLANTLLAALLLAGVAGGVARAGGDLGDAPPPGEAAAEAGADVGAATPAADCLERTVDALQSRYEGVRDLSARFVQTTHPAHTGAAPEPIRSSGRMVVQKPAKMRWSYETPEESLVVSDGESLWTYDPAFGEAQRLPVGEGFLSGAAVSFLLGEGDLRRDFEVSLVSCETDRAELELRPREPASYERLRVVADPRDGTLSRTRIDDLLGNVTVVELSRLETNRSPDPSTFRFVPPEGVRVVELQPMTPSGPGPRDRP